MTSIGAAIFVLTGCFRQIFGSRVRVDSTAKVAEIELAEKEKMKEKVERILKHGINCFINRYGACRGRRRVRVLSK